MSPLTLYLSLFFAPFLQEDAAVFAAAGAAAMPMANAQPGFVFVVSVAGLVVSDTWKFWAGRLAQRHPRIRAWADKPAVADAKDKVLKRLAATMFAVRFIPGTRIGAYVAAGLFGAPFLPFFAYVVASALLYVGAAFGVVHAVGVAAGRQANQVVAALVVALVAGTLLYGWLRARRRKSRGG